MGELKAYVDSSEGKRKDPGYFEKNKTRIGCGSSFGGFMIRFSPWLSGLLLAILVGCAGPDNPAGIPSLPEISLRVEGNTDSARQLEVVLQDESGGIHSEMLAVGPDRSGSVSAAPGTYDLTVHPMNERGEPLGVTRRKIELDADRTTVSIPVSEAPTSQPAQTEEELIQPRGGEKPNIVLIVLDDVDFTDLGSYTNSSDSRTPRLDQLASQGMRFTQFYSNGCKCSPTRASILTSHTPGFFGWRNVIDGITRSDGTRSGVVSRTLPWHPVTVAEALQANGYATTHIGKWHLGTYRPSSMPLQQGFAESARWGVYQQNQDNWPGNGFYWGYNLFINGAAFTPNVTPMPAFGQPGADANYLNKRLTDEAIAFIGRHQAEPFFINLWHFTAHQPFHVPAGYNNVRGFDLATSAGKLSAMLTDVDREIGRLLDYIDQAGLGHNTLILFVSDNGGVSEGRWAQANPRTLIRGGKGSLYEGGIRVPFIARWTGKIPSNTINHSIASTIDLLPTCVDAASIPIPAGVEGRSLYDNLTTGLKNQGPDLFWVANRFENYAAAVAAGATAEQLDQFAVRSGRYKLVRGPANNANPELFDLAAGPAAEFTNIADANPTIVNDLIGRYKAWHRIIGTIPFNAIVSGGILSIPFDPRFDTFDGDFTFSVDVRANTLGQNGVIAMKEGSWELLWVTDHIDLKLYDDRPGVPIAQRETRLASPALAAGVSHKVTFTVVGHLPNGNKIPSLYVNGTLAQRLLPDQFPAATALWAIAPNNSKITLGSRPDGTEPFDGSVGLPRMSTLALPLDEQQ
ncbi:hypothetical protein DYH09_17160 [bacterium CPR1]|nr:hypothetical protein [bacterium CPR1]